MTKEEKELVLKDLCARLPYGVHVEISWEYSKTDVYTSLEYYEFPNIDSLLNIFWDEKCISIKPYLRPISSITEEEERELNGLLPEVYDFTFRMDELLELIQTQKEIPFHYIDWFNAHHFDYRGFIEMGLALKAPEDLYD